MSTLDKIMKKIMKKYKENGLLAVFEAILAKIFLWPFKRLKNKCINLYILKRYDYVIQKYKNYAPPPVRQIAYRSMRA